MVSLAQWRRAGCGMVPCRAAAWLLQVDTPRVSKPVDVFVGAMAWASKHVVVVGALQQVCKDFVAGGVASGVQACWGRQGRDATHMRSLELTCRCALRAL